MTGSARVLSRIAELRAPSGETLPLRRAWPHSPTELTLEYASGEVVVAGHWSSDREALRRTAAADEHMAIVEVEGEQVALQAAGTDVRLRGLEAAVGLPGARLVSHRAQRRATVAVPGAYLKIVRPGRVGAAAAAHRAVHAVAAPSVLSEDEQAGVLALGRVPGRALRERLAEPGAAAAVRATGAAIHRLHKQDAPEIARARVHGAREEAMVLTDWLQRLLWHDPATYAKLGVRAQQVLDDLAGLRDVRPALIHRDLHDKQVLVAEDGGIALIDLDTLTLGDPAIDLGNLAAHFDLRARQAGAQPGSHGGLRDALLAGYDAREACRRRIAVYEQATLLRLACVYAFRPRWAAVAASLAEHGAPPG